MQRLFNIFIIVILLVFTYTLPSYSFQKKCLTIAQITDLHLMPTKESIENYNMLIDSINKDNQIDFVVFTGDNIDKANIDLLEIFLKMTRKFDVPYYVQIGNHDCLKPLGLSKKKYIETLNKYSLFKYKTFNYIVKKGDFVFVFLDGSKEMLPSSNGYFKEDTLIWLDKTLTKYQNKNIIIFQHYPMYKLSENHNHNLYNPEPYQDLLKKHKNVKAVYAGHYHKLEEKYTDGILNVTAPPAKYKSSEYMKIYIYKAKNKQYKIYNQVIKFKP